MKFMKKTKVNFPIGISISRDPDKFSLFSETSLTNEKLVFLKTAKRIELITEELRTKTANDMFVFIF